MGIEIPQAQKNAGKATNQEPDLQPREVRNNSENLKSQH